MVDYFAQSSIIINTRVLLKNYKKYKRRNWGQSKDKSNIFENSKNSTNIKENNRTIIDFSYDSNNL